MFLLAIGALVKLKQLVIRALWGLFLKFLTLKATLCGTLNRSVLKVTAPYSLGSFSWTQPIAISSLLGEELSTSWFQFLPQLLIKSIHTESYPSQDQKAIRSVTLLSLCDSHLCEFYLLVVSNCKIALNERALPGAEVQSFLGTLCGSLY